MQEPYEFTDFKIFAFDGLVVRVVRVMVLRLGLGGKDNVVHDWLFRKRRPSYATLGGRGRNGTSVPVGMECLVRLLLSQYLHNTVLYFGLGIIFI